MLTRSMLEPDSPSLTHQMSPRQRPSSPESPSYSFCMDAADSKSEASSGDMVRANCARASRAARACDPSPQALSKMASITTQQLRALETAGIQRAPPESAFRSYRAGVTSGGKGPGVRTSVCEQSVMNHLASLKAKDVDTNNSEPAYLLGGEVAPLAWDRLAESSIKANAVNSSVLGRRKTQGAPPHAPAFQHNPCTNCKTCCLSHRCCQPDDVRRSHPCTLVVTPPSLPAALCTS